MEAQTVADAVNANEPDDLEVTFQPIGKRIRVKIGTTLLEAGRRAGLLLSAACGGVGVCGRCQVRIVSGEMFPPESEERNFLHTAARHDGSRLACEARVAASVVVEVPPGSFNTGQRLQLESEQSISAGDPLVESWELQLGHPSLQDSRSDYARVAEALSADTGRNGWIMHPSVARQAAVLAPRQNWVVTAFVRGEEIIGFAEAGKNAIGLAVDVGCTKIAAYLLDLKQGIRVAAAGAPNPQIPYGEDLISRLVYATKDEKHAEKLGAMVCESIAELADELCQRAEVSCSQIADVCVVGNTAMMHLLLQLPVERLLHAPFVAAINRDMDFPARELGWKFAPQAGVHILPSIGGFVGADHVAMILAQGIDFSDKVTIGLDIGTNTEIVVRDPRTGKFVSTSVPSGPVFEGGHIVDGMRAASGAIDRFYSVEDQIRYGTMDDGKPVGLCGSGVLDLVAELAAAEYLDERGHLLKRDSRISRGGYGLQYLVVPGAETGHGRDIVFSQHDVTQVQLAKAAIAAGIETLLQVTGTECDSVQEVVVAGAFGSYLNLRSAIAIGLLPRLPNAKYLQVGNAAGAGAQIALLSRSERERAQRIARAVTKIELKQHKTFDRLMARATRFPSAVRRSSIPLT